MQQRCVLVLLCAILAAVEGRDHCHSGIKGVFQFKTCSGFCKEARRGPHCKFCKCQACAFCGGTFTSAPAASSPAVKSTPVPGGGVIGQPLAPAVPSVATTSTPAAATGTAAATAAAPVPAASVGGGGWLLPMSCVLTLVLALICYFLAMSKPRSMPGYAAQPMETDEELLPTSSSSSKLSANDEAKSGSEPTSLPPPTFDPASSTELVQKRTLCVLFLCLQYSAYALLRRCACACDM